MDMTKSSTRRILALTTADGHRIFQHSILVYPNPAGGYKVGDAEGTLEYRSLVSALFAADGLREEAVNRDSKGRKASVIYSRNGSAPYYLLDGKPSDIDIIEAIEGGAL